MDTEQTTGFDYHDVRILFGPLFGTDILVVEREIFFCVGGEATFGPPDNETAPHALNQATNAFYVPWRENAPNIRLRFNSIQSEDRDNETAVDHISAHFTVEYLLEEGGETHDGQFNVVCRSGDIAFAVKRHNNEWSEQVRQYTCAPAGSAALVNALDENKAAGAEAQSLPSSRLPLIATLCAIALLGVAATALAWWFTKTDPREQRLAMLHALLVPAPGTNYVLPAGDVVHIFSATQAGAQWDRHVLLKIPQPYPVRIVSLDEERQRVESILEEQAIPFVTVRINDPAHPVLALFAHAADDQRQRATEALKKAMPYAKTISVMTVTLESLDDEAQALLTAAACPFRRVPHGTGATYLVTGALGDESLASLQRLVQKFSQQWGTQSIQFRVQMRTDWLKGKTYRNGSDGYVLLDPASWYFPQPL